MQVVLYRTLDKLAPLAGFWDRLSGGIPFRSWTWCRQWWETYGSQAGELFVPVVLDPGGWPIGIAPWFRRYDPLWGRTLRFLGSGEVCSDHLTVLCEPGMEITVAQVLADWLTAPRQRRVDSHKADADSPAADPVAAAPRDSGWDMLELTGVLETDVVVGLLLEALSQRRARVDRRSAAQLWRIPLENSWDEQLMVLSKNRRRKFRRLERDHVQTGHAVLHSVERLDQLPRGQAILLELHQRRRQSLGDAGAFSSPWFRRFHCEVMPELLRQGQLGLHWVEYDGRPVAIDYQLQGGGVVYAYQSGVEPECLDVSPGHLANLLTIRRAIDSGVRVFDLLRGDERYKRDLGAVPHPLAEYRIVPPRWQARLRLRLWTAGKAARGAIKQALSTRPEAATEQASRL